eukprot:TRINITY_DN8749_c0_g1_i1.p1 TRINITY_DN8749_c0_g1~~TRINITY_DN8749_c0_g1_i1.p1  ORF type:complete len:331 (+),score=56.01 TRINITY_DN8749_c0_g1_i1:152-1144(+)
MTSQEIAACDISRWYRDFEAITFKTEIVQLSPAFVDFLRREGIFLPDNNTVVNDWTSDSENENWDSLSQDEAPQTDHKLPDDDPSLLRIESIFEQPEMGSILPKLNWKCPTDAGWMTLDGSLRCCNLEQILLLIKSSDACMDALNQLVNFAADGTILPFAPTLALRKWTNVDKSMEFRCFIKNRSIIAICQRDRTFYRFLLEMRRSIRDRIVTFFQNHIKDKFPLNDYVIDVYLQGKSKVLLVDFAPFNSETTNAILFDWEELQSDEFATPGREIEVRLLESENIQPDYQARIAGMPYDLVSLAANLGEGRQADADAIVDVLRQANDESK